MGPDTEADGDFDVTESLDLVGAGAATTDHRRQRLRVPGPGAAAAPPCPRRGGGHDRARLRRDHPRLAWRTRNGGGIANAGDLTLSDCCPDTEHDGVLARGSYDGGGIANAATGILSVSRCTIAQNHGRNGGGIANAGTATIEETTIEGNFAVTGGGVANSGTLTIANSTISGNTADRAIIGVSERYTGFGAAIADYGGLATLEHVTLANNVVATPTSTARSAPAQVSASRRVSRRPATCSATRSSGGAPVRRSGDCGTPAPTSLGHNIDGDGTCLLTGIGDLPATDPGLGPLDDNGGPTLTHAIAPGSPPHDAGDAGACPATDQRGVPRPQGAGCDIGAYEDNFPCNNSMLDPGEICDDGSPAAGGCCTFDCSTFVASGVACENNNQCTAQPVRRRRRLRLRDECLGRNVLPAGRRPMHDRAVRRCGRLRHDRHHHVHPLPALRAQLRHLPRCGAHGMPPADRRRRVAPDAETGTGADTGPREVAMARRGDGERRLRRSGGHG